MVDTAWTEVSRTDWSWQDTAGIISQTTWDGGLTIWDRLVAGFDTTVWDPVYTTTSWTGASTSTGTTWSSSGDL